MPERITSPRRTMQWSKNTGYPTAAKSRLPVEVSNVAMATQRRLDRQLHRQKENIDSIHSKSISGLESQRKQLEASMLAYSEKMRELNKSRVNDVFTEISNSPKKSRSLPGSIYGMSRSATPVTPTSRTNQPTSVSRLIMLGDIISDTYNSLEDINEDQTPACNGENEEQINGANSKLSSRKRLIRQRSRSAEVLDFNHRMEGRSTTRSQRLEKKSSFVTEFSDSVYSPIDSNPPR